MAALPDAKAAPKKQAANVSQPSQASSTAELARLNAALATNHGNADQIRKQIAALQAAIAKAHHGTAGQQPPAANAVPNAPVAQQPSPGHPAPVYHAPIHPAGTHPGTTHPAPAESSPTQPAEPAEPSSSAHPTPSPTPSHHPTHGPSSEPSDPGGGDD
jgi:hypothetical protein